MTKRILITDDVDTILLEELKSNGFQYDYFPDIENEAVKSIIAEYEGIIINSKINLNKDTLQNAINLKWIARLGSGLEIIDIEFAKQKGISIYSVPEANNDAVAEHAIGMLLALFNHLVRANAEVKNGEWYREKNRGLELGNKTIAIIGYGHTGKAFAKKIKSFEVNILAYDKYLNNYSDEYVNESTLEEIYEKADVVSFHLPLSAETTYFCNRDFVLQFKKAIFILNTSRGKVVHLDDILPFLETKKILGLGLDVFENEKVNSYNEEEKVMYAKLFAFENVIVSPHIAGWTKESKIKIAKYLVKKIINYYKL